MTITQISTFIKIAEMGNFSLAANALGYAQSTVTMQIKQLEDELGVELFDRLGKSVSLTSAGERLLIHAEKMLQIEREILSEVPSLDEASGVIKLGISESLCYNRLPGILLEYRRKFPKVDLRLSLITHDVFPDMLKKGTLDIVYTLNPLIERDDLLLIRKKPETLGFYVASNHPLSRKKTVSETDLPGVPLLLTSHNCSFRKMLLADLEANNITPNIALETGSKEILKQLAMNELGVAFMPDMVTEEEIKTGALAKMKWKGAAFPIYSQIFIHKDKHMNKAMQGLIDMIN